MKTLRLTLPLILAAAVAVGIFLRPNAPDRPETQAQMGESKPVAPWRPVPGSGTPIMGQEPPSLRKEVSQLAKDAMAAYRAAETGTEKVRLGLEAVREMAPANPSSAARVFRNMASKDLFHNVIEVSPNEEEARVTPEDLNRLHTAFSALANANPTVAATSLSELPVEIQQSLLNRWVDEKADTMVDSAQRASEIDLFRQTLLSLESDLRDSVSWQLGRSFLSRLNTEDAVAALAPLDSVLSVSARPMIQRIQRYETPLNPP